MTRSVTAWLLASLLLLAGDRSYGKGSAVHLTELESRGKHVYTITTSPSGGEITALLTISSVEAPGEAMPCVNCHGADGLGRPEGDIIPSNISWKELTKPYRVKRPGGRDRPPYTEETLAMAITRGVDPAGNTLASSMPVYTMPPGDLEALIAYLKKLGVEQEVGVSDAVIRLATVLPVRGRFAETGKAMESMIRAYLSEVNGKGGIYNRRLELEVIDYGESGQSALAAVNGLVERGDTFALVAPFLAGADQEIAALANTANLPIVGPYTLFPLAPSQLNRCVFYLFSGLREEAEAFLQYAAGSGGDKGRPVAVVSPDGAVPADVLEAIAAYARRKGFQPLPVISYPPGALQVPRLSADLKAAGVELILFYGAPEELAALAEGLSAADWHPRVFLSGSPVNMSVFNTAARLERGLFLAYPVIPSDQSASGSREISRLMDVHGLPKGPFRAQLSAFCACKVMVEALKTVGRQLTREALIVTLERLFEFETGLMPKITYGPNRRIGALGAYILRVDAAKKDLSPVGGWIVPSGP
ncbi:MAG: ABC transporter substrate-binding protein [Syntrophobacteraceae bacterium]